MIDANKVRKLSMKHSTYIYFTLTHVTVELAEDHGWHIFNQDQVV
jgi:hypothetical protein